MAALKRSDSRDTTHNSFGSAGLSINFGQVTAVSGRSTQLWVGLSASIRLSPYPTYLKKLIVGNLMPADDPSIAKVVILPLLDLIFSPLGAS